MKKNSALLPRKKGGRMDDFEKFDNILNIILRIIKWPLIIAILYIFISAAIQVAKIEIKRPFVSQYREVLSALPSLPSNKYTPLRTYKI